MWDFGAKLCEYTFQLCHLLTNRGQVNLMSLCFIYLIYKMRMIIISTLQGLLRELNKLIQAKCLEQRLAGSTPLMLTVISL